MGASHFTAFFQIALPLAAPAMAATGLIIFAFAWNEFLFAITISSKNALTIPVHMAGLAADLDAINAIAARHNIPVKG